MRRTFDLIEAAGERGNAEADKALQFISATIAQAFEHKPDGFKLDGSDPCERVAEALAVWLKESAPRAFADMTGTRYSVTGVDDSADGMERLRDQSEIILLAYPGAGSTPTELRDEWLNDMCSTDYGDGFNYDAAESAIRTYCAESLGYLESKIAALAELELGEWDESPAFRLYVRDNAPESDK